MLTSIELDKRNFTIFRKKYISFLVFKQELNYIWETLKNTDLWFFLAWSDIKARYRRTIIGPFWLVLANGITISGMAIIWSLIFRMNLSDYFPKLTAAMIVWTLISYTTTESASTFIQHGSIIQNLPVSIYIYPLRIVSRNVITFFHNLILYLFVIVIFRPSMGVGWILFPPFFFLIFINFFCFSVTSGIIGTRYRDFPQILTALMSVLVFVTPVMWDAKMLGDYSTLANINPFTHFLNVLKFPLLGQIPPLFSVVAVFIMTILNCVLMILMSIKYKNRIPFWV